MSTPRIQEKDLLSTAEMELFNLSQSQSVMAQRSPAQLRDKITRARGLRDRARALYRKQVGRTLATTSTKRGFTGLANERTRQKAEVLDGVVTRLSAARAQQLEAA